MPARPRIPDPQEGPLQEFAYGLRELGEGKVSVGWIAEQEQASRAALYAALSGNRLPAPRTLSALLRWWVGNPADETPIEEMPLWEQADLPWAWVQRLPSGHKGQRAAETWYQRYRTVGEQIADERGARPAAEPVTIAVPPEQEHFISELKKQLRLTDLEDEPWLIFGSHSARVERYLAGHAIPTDASCWETVEALRLFLPEGFDEDAGIRLVNAAEAARAGRARQRRMARNARKLN